MCTSIFPTVLLSIILQFVFWHGEGLGCKAKPGNKLAAGSQGFPRVPAAALFSGSSSAQALAEAEVDSITIDFSLLTRPEKKTLISY